MKEMGNLRNLMTMRNNKPLHLQLVKVHCKTAILKYIFLNMFQEKLRRPLRRTSNFPLKDSVSSIIQILLTLCSS